MLTRLHRLFSDYLRWRIAAVMVVVITMVVAVLVSEVTRWNQETLRDRFEQTATALGQSIGASSAVWLLSHDYSGVQEIVRGLQAFPDLRYVVVSTGRGLIVAHTDKARLGQYLQGLPARPQVSLMYSSAQLVDVAVPVLMEGQQLGWVRVGLGSSSLEMAQQQIRWRGLLFALGATAVGVLLAFFSARRLSGRLDRISRVADAVQSGVTGQRAKLQGSDEAARLGSAFDTMLDTLEQQQADLARQNLQLASHREQLEQEVRLRTRDLEQARMAAEAANIAKGSFIANMSHEIRTPMNAIYGMSHLLQKTPLTVRQKDYVQKILLSGEHLLGIINDILDFSKIEAGKLQIEETEFEFERVMNNVANLIGEKASQKGLELLFDVAPDVPQVLCGDPLRLGQILVNFGNNAVKFTEHGEICISVRVQQRSSKQAVLHFEVSDTGIGISAEQQARLFQRFEQGDVSTTRKFGGTGLGLAICQRLSELMHGEVGVRSQEGQGSVFWLTLPLGISLQPVRSAHSAPEPGSRVLVVDDHAGARDALQEMLSQLGYQVQQAERGEQALQAVRAAAAGGQPFRLILLDWQMPGLNGIDTAQQIRELNLNPPPAIALITAYGREEVLKAAELAGLQHVLFKPVSPSLLNDTVTEILSARALSPSPQQNTEQPVPDFGQQRVLLAEDNPMNQELACELLALAGLQVQVAANGEEAVALASRHPYALVLMDMQMPVMDGLEATRRLRRTPGLQQLPVIAMTANVMQEDRQRCFDAGMNDFLGKPIHPEILYDCLRRWLPVAPAGKTEPAEAVVHSDPLPAGLPAALAQAEGLHCAEGLALCGGKEERYLRMLERFTDSQEQAVMTAQQALAAQDWEGAERSIHTLKGSAAQIGAAALAKQAAGVQQALHVRRHNAEDLAALQQVLHTLCSAIRRALPSDTPPVPRITATVADAQGELLTELLHLVRDDNARALTLLQQYAPQFRQLLGEADCASLMAALQSYDFERALQVLQPHKPTGEL